MSHVCTPLYPVLLLPLQSVQRLLSLIGLYEPFRGLQGILLRGQLERDGRLFALRLDEHALLVLPGHAGDDGKVELRQPEAERAALLGDVADAGGAGAGAQQRNGDEVHDAPGRVAVAVDDLVEQLVGVALRADARHAAVEVHALLARGHIGLVDVRRDIEVGRAGALLRRRRAPRARPPRAA